MKKFSHFFNYFNSILFYLKSDLIKRQRDFKIGLIAIFLVVFFLTLLFNAIQMSSCIFITLSEQQNGEIDLVLTPNLQNKNTEMRTNSFNNLIYNKETSLYSNLSANLNQTNFLNFNEIRKKLSNLSFIEGFSPRWYFFGKASKKFKEKQNSKNSIEFNTNIVILDSSIENDIGIGRNLDLPELKKNECYISETLNNALKVNTGDEIQLEIKISDLIKLLTMGVGNSQEYAEKMKSFEKKYDYNDDDDDKNHKKHFHKKKREIHTLKDKYDKEDNIDDKNNFKRNNNYGFKVLNVNENNKNKNNNKNPILDYGPVKQMLVKILNEYINDIIVDYLNKSIKLFKHYFPKRLKNNNLSSFVIKKSDLKYLFSDIPQANDLINKLFVDDNNLNKPQFNHKEDMFQNIISLLLRKIIIYNKSNDLIYFDKDLLKSLSSGNLTSFIEKNVDYDALLNDNKFSENFTQFFNIKLNLTVGQKIKSTYGKWPSSFGNVLAIDSRHVKDYLYINSKRITDEILKILHIENMEKIIWKTIDNYIKNFDINNYALTINAIFKDKFNIYKENVNNLRYYISEMSEDIINSLGLNYSVNINTPIYGVIKGFNVIKIFLSNILYCIMVFLWILSIVLVNSLMLGNVDERTYEFGMMRALGFDKDNLLSLILLKGFVFSLPGIILGLSTSYIANNYVAYLFNWYTGLVMPFFLSKINILFGIISGLSIPLISSYFPIKKCLENNLRDTLTIFSNKKANDIFISIIKLETMGISPTTFIASITLVVIGLLTYYVVPFSYYSDNLTIFLLVMLVILISMLIGSIMLSLLLVPNFQKIILNIITFFAIKDRKFHLIISRNLDGHKRRNRQVSIMLIIAIGFLIFSGCTLNLVVDFVDEFSQKLIGGDFSITITDKNIPNMTLNEISINNYFEKINKNHPNLINNYTFISFDFKDIISPYGIDLKTRISAFNGYPSFEMGVSGIDKTYIESSRSFLYNYGEYDTSLNKSYSHGKIDLVKMMHDNKDTPYLLKEKNITFIHPQNKNIKTKKILKKFQLNFLAAEGIKKRIGISVDNQAQFKILTSPEHSIPCKIIGFVKKLPGSIYFSSYEPLAMRTPVIITKEQMKQLVDIESQIYNFHLLNLSNVTVDGVRKRRLIASFKENASKELKQMVFFAMNNYLEGINTINLQFTDISDITEETKNVIEYILLIIGIIALILSFFLIWISFYNNIRENIAEYGIMRSIGITKVQNIRIYLYEAAAIIITSIIIGTFIGIIISCSLILQFDIFVELPFIFNFPYKFFFILIFVGLFLGLLGSYYPTYDINNYSLVKIMKGFND